MILQQHKFKRYSFTTLTLEPTENSVNLFLRRLVFCWVQGTVRKKYRVSQHWTKCEIATRAPF